MKKLIIAVLAVSSATIVYAHAETPGQQTRGSEFHTEMRALIAGDGLKQEDFVRLMQERSQARFTALDANEDGVVNLQEVIDAADKKAQIRFEQMNPDENGLVTRTGRKGRHSRIELTPEQRAERLSKRASEQFSRLDANSDGSISREEFETGLQARTERRPDRAERHERRKQRGNEAPAGFHKMRTEFRTLLRDGMDIETFSQFMRNQATTHFETLDADGDGELTFEEFTARNANEAERRFARMDSDGDGVVTGKDRPQRGWHGRTRK